MDIKPRAAARAFLAAGLLALAAGPALSFEAARLADGAPWAMTNANGPNGQLVMNADGTGQMRARGMRMGMTWEGQGDRLCINSRMRGTRCVTLMAQGDQIVGVEDGQVAFTLAR